MKKRPGRGRGRLWPDLMACFVIPAYTLLFAGSVQWLGTNFSVLAVTGRDHYRGFVLWGLLAAGYFLVILFQVAATLPRPPARWGVRLLTVLGCLALVCALLVPYLPDYFPKIAQLHILLAFSACVLVMLALLWALLACFWRERARYAPLLWGWAGVVAGSGAIFAVGGMVTSALEVFFTISAALLARTLWLRRKAD